MKRVFVSAVYLLSQLSGACTLASVNQRYDLNTTAINQTDLSDPSKFKILSRQHDPQTHITHTRYQQLFRGHVVYGQQIIAHSQPGQAPWFTGHIATNIRPDLPAHGSPKLTPIQAIQFIQAMFPNTSLSVDRHLRSIIYIDPQKQAHLAYRIEFLALGHYPRRPVFIIDAHSKKLLSYHNNLDNLHSVKAQAYGGHQFQPYTYGITSGYPTLDVRYQHGTCSLENDLVLTIDLRHRYTKSRDYLLRPPSPYQYSCRPETHYLNRDKTTTNQAINLENDAHYFGTVVTKMYQDWYRLRPIPNKLIMRVHYGKDYPNAFWDGLTMTFGDGNSQLFPLVSLEIACHEVSHGFTQHHANLEYHGQSGAVNESFSDMASKACQFFTKQPIHWSIGENVVKKGQGVVCEAGGKDALRCMNNPHATQDSVAIGDAREYKNLITQVNRVDQLVAIDNDFLSSIIREFAINAVDQYFKNGALSAEKKQWLIQKYQRFLSTHFSRVFRSMILNEIKQNIIVHNASGVFNRAFYLLATTPGWDVRKAFDVMVNANRFYWQSNDTFPQIGDGIRQAAVDLNYPVADVTSVLNQVGLACQNQLCRLRQDNMRDS